MYFFIFIYLFSSNSSVADQIKQSITNLKELHQTLGYHISSGKHPLMGYNIISLCSHTHTLKKKILEHLQERSTLEFNDSSEP